MSRIFQCVVTLSYALCSSTVLAEMQSLDLEAFSSHLGQHKTMVIAFVAPWCNKCKELLPEWESMAESMDNTQDGDIYVAKVDCVEQPDVYYKEDIQYFPTIKTFVNYNAMSIEYDGERKANTMWRYFRLMHEQYVNEVTSVEEFTEIQGMKLNKDRPLVLAIVSPDDELDNASEVNRKVDAACKKADRVRCYFARNPEFVEKLGLSENSLTLFSSFNGDEVDNSVRLSDITGNTAADISDWIIKSSYPPVVELTSENDQLIFSSRRPGFHSHFLFLINDVSSDEGQAILSTLNTAAVDSVGKCVFIYIDLITLADNAYASGVIGSLDADITVSKAYAVTSKKPLIRFYNGLDGQLNDASAIKTFVNGVLEGSEDHIREINTEE